VIIPVTKYLELCAPHLGSKEEEKHLRGTNVDAADSCNVIRTGVT
jgi:hypothetical protein